MTVPSILENGHLRKTLFDWSTRCVFLENQNTFRRRHDWAGDQFKPFPLHFVGRLFHFCGHVFHLGGILYYHCFVHCIYLRSAREPLRRVDNVLSLIGIYNLDYTRKEIAWQLIISKACVHTKFISSPGEYLFTKSLSGFYFQMVAILPSAKV